MIRQIFVALALVALATATAKAEGWSDGTDYFDAWGCSAANGINAIARLDILPLGTHAASFWKHSLFVNGRDRAGGHPLIYFTAADKSAGAGSLFSLMHAAFDGARWDVVLDLAASANPGGVASFDGDADDFVFNEVFVDGWGPVANKAGIASRIPGVAAARDQGALHAPGTLTGYPLVGDGPRGLNAIRSLQQNQAPEASSRTCIHMHPALYGAARDAMLVDLWAFDASQPGNRAACLLPDGSRLPVPGYYVYRYDGLLGWQLASSEPFTVDGGGTLNLIAGTKDEFVRGGGGRVPNELALVDRAGGQTAILRCAKSGLMTEAAGVSATQIYFLGDADGCGAAAGLDHGVCAHDVYVAFKDPGRGTPQGWRRALGSAVYTDAANGFCRVADAEGLHRCTGLATPADLPMADVSLRTDRGLCTCAAKHPGK
jgi:hypothetical protein